MTTQTTPTATTKFTKCLQHGKQLITGLPEAQVSLAIQNLMHLCKQESER